MPMISPRTVNSLRGVALDNGCALTFVTPRADAAAEDSVEWPRVVTPRQKIHPHPPPSEPKLALEPSRHARKRVDKCQAVCQQLQRPLIVISRLFRQLRIQGVAHNWCTQRGHMHAQL